MFDFEKPRIEIAEISEDKKYGRFVVEPLERGYGTTLGNSLRRIMLSSLPGSAVSQIKIDGVVHEFSGIPGVKEDVTEIVMNIKNLAIKNNSEDMNTPKMMYIDATGEGVVTAADIKCDSDIEIVNSDQVIATLNGGAVEAAMKGMLEPIYEEKVIAHAEVRQTFKASGVGTIAGSYVLDGKIERGCRARITREGEQIFEGDLSSLKRFKDDVKEVAAGYECGLVFDGFNDLQEEDQIECYKMVEVPR